MPLSVNLEVYLELLKQSHQVVQMLWQGQVESFLLNICEFLFVFFGSLFNKLLLLRSLNSMVHHLCSLKHFIRSIRLILNVCLVFKHYRGVLLLEVQVFLDFLMIHHLAELHSLAVRVWRIHGTEELWLSIVFKAVLVLPLALIAYQDELLMLICVSCLLLM